MYRPLDPGTVADLRYIGDKKSSTDESLRGKRCCQKKTRNKKSRGGKARSRICRSSSHSDEIVSYADRNDELDRKKTRSHSRKKRAAKWYSDDIEIWILVFPSQTRRSHYPIVRTNGVVVLIPVCSVAKVAREDAHASSGNSIC